MKPKLIHAKELKAIEGILNKWNGKLTWDDFAKAVARELGRENISKFTLMSYEPIKQAYNRRKDTLRDAKSDVIATLGDVTLDMLIQENAQLREQIRGLEIEMDKRDTLWAEKFRTWQYNISQIPSFDLSKLDEPLPKIYRD